MTITLNAITAAASTGALGAVVFVAKKTVTVGKAIAKFVGYVEDHDLIGKAKRVWAFIEKADQHLEQNAAAVEVAADASQIAAQPADIDPAYRTLLIKDLLRDTIAAFKIEAGQLAADPVYRQTAITFIQAKVPEPFKPFVPQLFDELVQSITSGLDAAQSHDVIQAVYKIKPSA